MRLLCFPYAGGAASAYRGWQARLPAEVEVCAVQLPGREERLREPPVSALDALVAQLRFETAPLRSGTFAFFGHSLGALVAFELTRALSAAGEALPAALLVSACRAPHLGDEGPRLGALDDAGFVRALRGFAGTPEAVLQDPDLLALVLPTLRADLALRDGYAYRDAAPLPLPIAAFFGAEDPHVVPAHVASWRAHTARDFSLESFSGGHFFFRESDAFFPSLAAALSRLAQPDNAHAVAPEASHAPEL